MRIAVTGATGNVGTSVLGALSSRSDVEEIVGIARRRPDIGLPKVRWETADVSYQDLAPVFAGVDEVIHLAWEIQPSHFPEVLRRTNVVGSRRVFEAAVEAGVQAVIYASSVGAYSPGPKDHYVDESWPTNGVPGSAYSSHKAEVERLLDTFEGEHPQVRWVRIRPGLIFKRESASEIARLFLGRFVPPSLLRFGVPFVPDSPSLRFQGLHASDVARGFASAVGRDVRGAYNLAAEPVLDGRSIAKALKSRRLPVPDKALRIAADLTWRAHVQPTDPGWVDMALSVPLMSVERARKELDWEPSVPATTALAELVQGLATVSRFPTPRLRER